MQNSYRIVSGTAQIGKKYGVVNHTEFSTKNSFETLEKCYANGVRIFDTAHSYGIAENVLKEFIHTWGIKDVEIYTKVTCQDASGFQSFLNYYEDLFGDALRGIFSHDNLSFTHFKKKNESMIPLLGASVYGIEDLYFLEKTTRLPEIVQIPFNPFEIQYLRNLPILKKWRNEHIFIRSIFLQGCLVGSLLSVPAFLREFLAAWHIFCEKNKLSKIAACISWVSHNFPNSNFVIGLDNPGQVDEFFKQLKDTSTEFVELWEKELENREIPYWVYRPNLWKGKEAEIASVR